MDILGKTFSVGKDTLIFLFLFLLISSIFSSSVLAGESAAVLNFGGGEAIEYRNKATNYLTQILIDLDRMDIISRSQMERVMEEQHLQLSGLVSGGAAEEAGGVLGVNRLFVGNIDRLSVERDDGEYDGEARITVQLIDVATGQILDSFSAEGSSSSEANRTAARNEALESAIDNLRRPIREAFAITSFVTHISDGYADLMGGIEMGIQSGHRYHIMRFDESGFSERIGMVEIEQVTADTSRASVVWQSEEIKEGDTLQEVPYNLRTTTSVAISSRTQTFSQPSSTNFNLSTYEDDYSVVMIEFKTAAERVFDFETSPVLSLGFGDSVTFLGGGLEGTYKTPINPGGLYLTGTAGAGVMVGFQSELRPEFSSSSLAGESATAVGFYGDLGAGVKYYTDYEDGFRIRAGVDFRLGSEMSTWEKDDVDYANALKYGNVELGGVGFNVAVTMPFDLFDLPF